MNGIDNLALYKTVDELQESKNSIERRTGIVFQKMSSSSIYCWISLGRKHQKPKKKGKLK